LFGLYSKKQRADTSERAHLVIARGISDVALSCFHEVLYYVKIPITVISTLHILGSSGQIQDCRHVLSTRPLNGE
jgi:hypothetical protein